MTPTRADVVIRTYGPGQVAPLVDTIADIWADAHPEIVDTPGAATDDTDPVHDPPSLGLRHRFHQCRRGGGTAGAGRAVRRASRRSRQAATVASTSRGIVISGGPGESE